MTPLKTAIIIICISFIPSKAFGQPVPRLDSIPPPSYLESSLGKYRQQLTSFREQFRAVEMPDCRFFLFGMGDRTKLIYKKGCLIHAFSGEAICQWPFENDAIIPNEYTVEIETPRDVVMIYENEDGVFIRERGKDRLVPGTNSAVILPGFTEHRYSEILKVLHHEILINVVDSKPLPNYMVYHNPWRRDAAMMAMCLTYTGNLDLIKDWVLGLTDPYDRNNAGETEADNLGQTLYLLSLFADQAHPLVVAILGEAEKYKVEDSNGIYIRGRSDFHETPVYQTKWMKFGLRSMELQDEYTIPHLQDDYASLFWWDYKDTYMPGTIDAGENWGHDRYPYIGWAADHFHHKKRNPISSRDYPLTWEIQASQASYEGMKIIDDIYVLQKTAVPHTWHAAEVFLYLIDSVK